MKLWSILLGACCSVGLAGCTAYDEDHPVFKYYPRMDILEEGYVSKYYRHYIPNDPNQTGTTYIEYIKVVRLGEDRFMTEDYNAGFQLTNSRSFEVAEETVMLAAASDIRSYQKNDTVPLEIINATASSWNEQKIDPIEIRYIYDDQSYLLTERQLSVYDTMILGHPAKVFQTESSMREEGSDSLFNQNTSKNYYVQNLGFFGSDEFGSDYYLREELIEQMSLAEFEKRAAHGEHRVAWIDPENTISDDSGFSLCGEELHIADYYNSTPDGRYVHNKRAMLDTIYAHLDPKKLTTQEGMLTFRFVVNCEGKAGRFIAESFDRQYQRMDFNVETVNHLFEILQKLKDWRSVVIREQPRDAYFYITFKLANGEVTDILP